MNLPNGTLLQGGKYRIERVLGQGGFGITYLATQVMLDRTVAIKEFFIQSLCGRDNESTVVKTVSQQNESTIARYKNKFLIEANTISKLHHPNIISIFDIFEENDTAYYVMEFVEGGSLQQIINEKRKLPEQDAVGYISQIANAVDYIHSNNINHFDIKPANILIRGNGSPVLIDFGISKIYDSSGERITTMPVGISDGYAPIEQYSQEGTLTFSPQADIYSLGATLYKLVTGKTPPSAPSRITDTALSLPTELTDSTRNAIIAAMALVKQDRPKSATIFERILLNESEEDKNQSDSKKRYITITIVCLLVLIGGVLLMLMNNRTNKMAVSLSDSILADSTAKDSTTNLEDIVTADSSVVLQDKSYTFSETFGDTTYRYSVKVNDGKLTVSLSSPAESYHETADCNPELDPDIIFAELKGVIYWSFANKFFWRLSEEIGYYRYDEYQWAKMSLSKSVSSFAKARHQCPSAFKKVQSMYNDLINSENSVDQLWEEITLLSYATGEYPIEPCDIY